MSALLDVNIDDLGLDEIMSLDLKITREEVAIDAVKPNPWNYRGMSPEMFAKELRSIKKYGNIRPILTRTLADGTREIIDGEHRWKAATVLKHTRMPIDDLGALSDRDAQKLNIIINETHGDVRYDELAALVSSMAAAGGTDDLYADLPYPELEMRDLLNAASTDTSLEDLADMESIDDGEEGETSTPEWDSVNVHAPRGVKARFDAIAKELTADVTEKIPNAVRFGIALEKLVTMYERNPPKPKSRKVRAGDA